VFLKPASDIHCSFAAAGVRGLASTWVFAAVGGIALLLQAKKESSWVFHPLSLVTVICQPGTLNISAAIC
jgi:hypothetical protein